MDDLKKALGFAREGIDFCREHCKYFIEPCCKRQGCSAYRSLFVNYVILVLDKATRWIPVTEELPKNDKQCLIRSKKGHYISAYRRDTSWDFKEVKNNILSDRITHWLYPFPDPPEGVSE